MSYGNAISITGNCGQPPELKFTPSGQAVATFSVAVSKRWQNKQTQAWEEKTSWVDVQCWRELAENVAESIERGMRVVVMGAIDQQQWETADGAKRSRLQIVAEEVGPGLSRATAQVSKNERQGAQNQGQEQYATSEDVF